MEKRSRDSTILWSDEDNLALIACRANRPLSHLLSTWAGPGQSINCRANGAGPSGEWFRTYTNSKK